ncbi:MAG TPA: entry exclusion 1 domain-containing protein, partial [Micavibrio sp.]
MAKVGAQRAADLTGRSKSTIQRAMNAGKLSFEVDRNGRRVIDVSELDRAFGLLPQNGGAGTVNTVNNDGVEAELKRTADLLEMERMKMRIKMLEEQVDSAREQLEDTKAQRDQWQKQAQQVL